MFYNRVFYFGEIGFESYYISRSSSLEEDEVFVEFLLIFFVLDTEAPIYLKEGGRTNTKNKRKNKCENRPILIKLTE